MARSHAPYSLCRKFPPTGEDELANAAPTEGNSTPTPTPAVSCAPTPASAIAPSSDNKLFKQFIKAYLEGHVLGQIEVDSEPCKQLTKARFADFYYGNLHMNCYRFCQQCKNHFETAGVKETNRILFAALFLRGLVTWWWL